jgi:hypothetical protein
MHIGGRTGPACGGCGTSGRRETMGKGGGKVNIMQIHVHMYVNEKTIPIETIQELWKGWLKENGGGGEFKYATFDISSIVNAIMYPHSAQQ